MEDDHYEGEAMDPPAFLKARQRSLDEQYKKEI